MERTKTMIHILSALDGKISGSFMKMPSAQTASEEYARIRLESHADAWLYGTTTTKEFTGYRHPVLDAENTVISTDDFIAEKNAAHYYVSVDTLGEIGWESGTFRKPGRPDAHIIEILTEQTSPFYRAYLQKRGVSYILAGKKSLDC